MTTHDADSIPEERARMNPAQALDALMAAVDVLAAHREQCRYQTVADCRKEPKHREAVRAAARALVVAELRALDGCWCREDIGDPEQVCGYHERIEELSHA